MNTRRRTGRGVAALLVATLAAACADAPEQPETPAPAPATTTPAPTAAPTPSPSTEEPGTALESVGVSAGHPAAAEAGMRVLRAGGNAVDAAIATAFAGGVVEPYATGIGGGGTAVVAPLDGEPEAYDYFGEVAADGAIPAGGVAVPGFVAGMAALHEDHGELPWPDLLAPAIELAADGHPVSQTLAVRLRNDNGPAVVAGNPQFTTAGRPLAEGEVLVQQELAATMRTLAEQGAAAFYEGTIADALVSVPGIDATTLSGYTVRRAEPVRGPVGPYEVLAAPPPLPGVALVQMLQVAEALGVDEVEPGSAAFVHRLSSAWQVAEQTVATELGDPQFVDVPVGELTDPARNAELAGPLLPSGPAAGPPRPGNTTHLSVVDADGLAVSMTNTIMHFWGSTTFVGGFPLNDQLTRFAALDSPRNVPEPGRRSVTWSLPVVVLDAEDRPVLVIGSPGGQRIPNILAGVLTRWGLLDQSLQEAVAAERFHLEGSTLEAETLPEDVAAELRSLGYEVRPLAPELSAFGAVAALAVDHEAGQVSGADEERREAAFAVEPAPDGTP